MSEERELGELRLTLPADAKAVATARLFAAASARQLGFLEHDVEDIRLAVSEAATSSIQAILSVDSPATLDITFQFDAEFVDVHVVDRLPRNGSGPGVNEAVIGAIFPRTIVGPRNDGAPGTDTWFRLERPPFKPYMA